MVIDLSKIIHGFHSNAAPMYSGSRSRGALATLPVGITKTPIVHLEGGSYLGNAERFALSQRDLGDYFCRNSVRSSRPNQRNAELCGFTHREVCVCKEEAPHWEPALESTYWINIRGMLMSSEAGIRKGQ